jgi:iron complex transport system ATP-binding protein
LNGAGKSTLLETLAGVLPDYAGSCQVQAREVATCKRADLSRALSFLPQFQAQGGGFHVRQVVAMGRYPHAGTWTESPDDCAAIDAAMRECQCEAMADRRFEQLSGGERQRVLMAATLAQAAPILVLDEPSTHADAPLQAAFFELLRTRADQGSLVIAAVHDVNLAFVFATRVLLLDAGRLAHDGAPQAFAQSQQFAATFGPRLIARADARGQWSALYERPGQ